jgi:hypothetical protein
LSLQVSDVDSVRNKYLIEKNDSLRIRYHLKYIYLLFKNNEGQKETEAELALTQKELEKFPVAWHVAWAKLLLAKNKSMGARISLKKTWFELLCFS